MLFGKTRTLLPSVLSGRPHRPAPSGYPQGVSGFLAFAVVVVIIVVVVVVAVVAVVVFADVALAIGVDGQAADRAAALALVIDVQTTL